MEITMVDGNVVKARSTLGGIRSRLGLMLLGALIAGLVGCGGGGGGGGSSPPSGGGGGGVGTSASFTISGSVSGLATGQQVILLNNADVAKAVTVTSDGAFTFSVSVPTNGSYVRSEERRVGKECRS